MTVAELDRWPDCIPAPAECRARIALLWDSEWETLELLARGFTRKEVARARGVQRKTTENQIGHLLNKLGVSNYTQAVIVLHRAEAGDR